MFNAVDIIVVGQFSGSTSLAAGQVYNSAYKCFCESVYGNITGSEMLFLPDAMLWDAGRKCQKQYILL